jgi:hypothetical protein
MDAAVVGSFIINLFIFLITLPLWVLLLRWTFRINDIINLLEDLKRLLEAKKAI